MLVEAEDKHFVWMLGGTDLNSELRLPPGGVDKPVVLEIVRHMASSLRAAYGPGSWMIVTGGEVVGLCSFKNPPNSDGEVEIGYGVAESRRERGHASLAIAELLEIAEQNEAIHSVVAETTTENIASQRVLERNGFAKEGKRIDPEDGEVILWRRGVSSYRS